MEEKTAAAEPRTGCFVCETAIPFLKNIIPQDTREHFRNSRVEFLKGIRTLIDHKISRLSPEGVRGTHVTVE
jgi:hypothetical protein